MKRRVVVTGIGSLSPFGAGVDTAWLKLLQGVSCVSKVESVDLSECRSQIGGEIKWSGLHSNGWFDPADYMPHKDAKRTSRFIVYGMAAAKMAMTDAGLEKFTDEDANRLGIILGTGSGGMDATEDGVKTISSKGISRLSPFFVPSLLCNLVCGHVAIEYNVQGPNFAVVSACAAGNHAIGESYRMIKEGLSDVIISGGSESAYSQVGFGGFAAMRALSTRNDDPAKASRPYDKGRDGFVMSEGAGVIILEEYERAKKRGAKIYGEILGYGLSSDANHLSSPHPSGRGAIRSMEMALQDAQINSERIDYINAHGTSTPMGDEIEINAVRKVFGDNIQNIPISSTKSSTGHMLGAAAALEMIFCLKALENNIIPATINLEEPEDFAKGLNLVPITPQEKQIECIMSNAFGFGGCNATIIIGKCS